MATYNVSAQGLNIQIPEEGQVFKYGDMVMKREGQNIIQLGNQYSDPRIKQIYDQAQFFPEANVLWERAGFNINQQPVGVGGLDKFQLQPIKPSGEIITQSPRPDNPNAALITSNISGVLSPGVPLPQGVSPTGVAGPGGFPVLQQEGQPRTTPPISSAPVGTSFAPQTKDSPFSGIDFSKLNIVPDPYFQGPPTIDYQGKKYTPYDPGGDPGLTPGLKPTYIKGKPYIEVTPPGSYLLSSQGAASPQQKGQQGIDPRLQQLETQVQGIAKGVASASQAQGKPFTPQFQQQFPQYAGIPAQQAPAIPPAASPGAPGTTQTQKPTPTTTPTPPVAPGEQIAPPSIAPEPSLTDQIHSVLKEFGITPPSPNQSPVSSAADIYKQFAEQTNIFGLKKDLQDLVKNKTQEIADVNENPWLSEGLRQRKIANIENKYQSRIDSLQSMFNRADEDARFLTGKYLDTVHQTQTQTQDILFKAIDVAEKEIAARRAERKEEERIREFETRQEFEEGKELEREREFTKKEEQQQKQFEERESRLEREFEKRTGTGKKVTSGSISVTSGDIGEGANALERSRGKDGNADTMTYLKMLKHWTKSGGLIQDFYKYYPPNDYLNEKDPLLNEYPSLKKQFKDKGSLTIE